MAQVTLRGNPIATSGELPAVGSTAPDFALITSGMETVSLRDLAGSRVVLNISPSVDTAVCATAVRSFNERATDLEDTKVLTVTADLPFAHARFCGAEGIENVTGTSTFRSDFPDVYGVRIIQAMVDHPRSRIVYKPHPRVADSDDPAIRSQHRAIVAAVNQAASDDPSAGHCVLEGADMLAVIPSTDVLIADVSSVSLDFLYLKPGAPLVITDRRTDRSGLLAESPVASVCHVVDADSIDQLSDDLRAVVTSSGDASRRSIRDHYFDGLEPGESTERFWAELDSAIREHDQALQSLSRIRTVRDGTAS